MSIAVISTVGQSVISNQPQDIRDAVKVFAKDTVDLESVRSDNSGFPGEDLHRLILSALQSRSNDITLLRRTSAEINSLTHILEDAENNVNDVLHFVASDTADGVLAARIVADFCMDYFEREVEVHIVRGLQVKDGTRFRREGLRNLIRLMYGLLDTASSSVYRRIINPTGGFKGVVPYLTIIGMLAPDVTMNYIYEQSDEILTLSGLPLQLDFSRLDAKILHQISVQRTLTDAELRSLIKDLPLDKPIDDHPIWAFLDAESSDEEMLYSLNGLGEIALKQLNTEQRLPVFLSRQAKERLDKTSPNSDTRRGFEKILNSIHDPDLRQNNMHTYPNGASALVYKLYRQDERAFYLEQEDHILVLELTQHTPSQSYDAVPTRVRDYGQHTRWPLPQKG